MDVLSKIKLNHLVIVALNTLSDGFIQTEVMTNIRVHREWLNREYLLNHKTYYVVVISSNIGTLPEWAQAVLSITRR